MINYVFDVDGTLTPSRQRIDKDFADFFIDFVRRNKTYLITGSDYSKTVEQLGRTICELVEEVHNCSGNSIWKNGEEIESSDWALPHEIEQWLIQTLHESKFYNKSGLHIEHRSGLVNFSIPGRACSLETRAMYVQWDEHKKEREQIAAAFNDEFKEKYRVLATVGGETGLDIAPVGKDKSQLADRLSGPIYFFGDKMDIGGNDYPLAKAIRHRPDSESFKVKDWIDTRRLLFAIENSDVHRYAGVV